MRKEWGVHAEVIAAGKERLYQVDLLCVLAQMRVHMNGGVLLGELPSEVQLEVGGGGGEAGGDGVSAGGEAHDATGVG